MAREIEIKLRVRDLAEMQRRLKKLCAALQVARVHEWNELFDTAGKELRGREQLLRIRTERPGRRRGKSDISERTILTFKGPVKARLSGGSARKGGKHRVREEIELEVTDRGALENIFRGLGMRVWFRYEKYRTTYQLPGSVRWARKLLIEVDETPIGLFVELEGPARAIDGAAKALGYSRRDYITANYFVLYRQACRRAGKKPGDMLFARRASR